jgi:hypothetical protein
MVGRTTRLTTSMIDRIVDVIARGGTDITVCTAVGIARSTYYGWLKRGANEKSGIYRTLVERVTEADVERELSWVGTIAENPTWQAKRWLLEHRYPHQWSQNATSDDERVSFPDVEQPDLYQRALKINPLLRALKKWMGSLVNDAYELQCDEERILERSLEAVGLFKYTIDLAKDEIERRIDAIKQTALVSK